MRIDILQLEFIDPLLRQIVTDLEETTGIELTITSLYRIDNSGVHGTLPLRAIDLRCRDLSLGLHLQEYVNLKWIYDPERPVSKQCALYHDSGQGPHLHIQVHPNTKQEQDD